MEDIVVRMLVQDAEQLLQDLKKKPNDVALLSQLIIGWYGIVQLRHCNGIDMDWVHLHGIVELWPCNGIDMDWVHNWIKNAKDFSKKTPQEQAAVHEKWKERWAS